MEVLTSVSRYDVLPSMRFSFVVVLEDRGEPNPRPVFRPAGVSSSRSCRDEGLRRRCEPELGILRASCRSRPTSLTST